MADRKPTKFKAPARAASPLIASKPLLVADARQAMEQLEKAEREKAGDPAGEEVSQATRPEVQLGDSALSERRVQTAAPRRPGKSPAPGRPVRIAVVPHLTAAATKIYNSLPVPQRDRERWLANLVRADFASWSQRALSDHKMQRQAADRLREPRRTYVSCGRLTFQTTADRIRALRDGADDTLKVYPDAAVVGIWVALQLEEALNALDLS